MERRLPGWDGKQARQRTLTFSANGTYWTRMPRAGGDVAEGGDGSGRWRGDAAVLARPSRLAAVERARLLLTASTAPLDRLARLAAAGGHAPIGLISLLDAEWEYFVATHGTGLIQVPVSVSLCQHVINTDRPVVIDDVDGPDGPPVPPAVRAAGVAAYAGFPVHLGGAAVGAVCVADHEARRWTSCRTERGGRRRRHGHRAARRTGRGQRVRPRRDPRRPAPVATAPSSTRCSARCTPRSSSATRTAAPSCSTAACATSPATSATRRRTGGPDREDTYHPDGRPMRTPELPLMRALAGERVDTDAGPDAPLRPARPVLPRQRPPTARGGRPGARRRLARTTRSPRWCAPTGSRTARWPSPGSWNGDPTLAGGRAARCSTWWSGRCSGPTRSCGCARATPMCADPRPRAAPRAGRGPGGAGPDLPPAPGHRLARLACQRGELVWADDDRDGPRAPRATLAVPIRSADRTLGVLTFFAGAVEDPPRAARGPAHRHRRARRQVPRTAPRHASRPGAGPQQGRVHRARRPRDAHAADVDLGLHRPGHRGPRSQRRPPLDAGRGAAQRRHAARHHRQPARPGRVRQRPRPRAVEPHRPQRHRPHGGTGGDERTAARTPRASPPTSSPRCWCRPTRRGCARSSTTC